MIKVLFVCLGNICRSPMAEAVFKDLIKKEKLENDFFVDSAAIGTWHIGHRPDRRTIEILKNNNIEHEYLIARLIKKEDGDNFNYIIGMDDENIKDIKSIISENNHHKIYKLLNFANEDRNVEDPYYTNKFEKTYDDILLACSLLLKKLKK